MKKKVKKKFSLLKKKIKEKQVPLGITIIALLHYIIAFSSLIFGILTLIAGVFSYSGIIIINSVFWIIIGIFMYFIGSNLWNGKNWARIVVIIFMGLGIISSFFYILQGKFSSFFGLGINLIIGGYLIFNKDVKKAFTN